MADERKIVIEVRYVDGQGKPGENPNDPDEPDTPGTDDSTGEARNKWFAKLVKSPLTRRVLSTAKNTVISGINMALTRRYQLTEDYIANTDLKNTMTTISKVGNLALGVVGGAIGGASFGPAGIAVGVATAVVGWGVSELYQHSQRMTTAYANLNATNAQTAYLASRAGLINGNRGTGN